MRICPACNNHSHLRLTKNEVEYFQCTSCKTLFSRSLKNDEMIGGGNEEQRNKKQNQMRIDRIATLFAGDRGSCNVLDFGCGHGMFVSDLIKAKYSADGYDVFNEAFSVYPENKVYNAVTMVEVIEHLSEPFRELNRIYRSLAPGGYVYIETSFVNIAEEEGIELEEFFYIDPSVGHSTIFSHHGLDVLMCLKGFAPMQHINRNVRIYQKQ